VVAWRPFVERQTHNRRRDIHAVHGGQQHGGICTPSDQQVIFLFTGEADGHHGYSDCWTDDGVLRYFDEGQLGDMKFERGNRSDRDHTQDRKDLLVFKTGRRGAIYTFDPNQYAGTSWQGHRASVKAVIDQPHFLTVQGEPNLEPHRTRHLSGGGPDDPRFGGAVCQDCHREILVAQRVAKGMRRLRLQYSGARMGLTATSEPTPIGNEQLP